LGYIIACHWGGLVTIPIAAQASSSHILHVLRSTSLKVLVIDDTHLEYILQLISETNVKHIVTVGENDEYKELEKDFGVTITCLSKLMSLGKDNMIQETNLTSTTQINIHFNILK
jgi:long-subunit acyl-CoA synthetase (AMP-forming)